MGSRSYSRRSNGRFRRATLENTFGLSAPSCPSCGRLNPHGVGEPPPENCHACGAPMKPDPKEGGLVIDSEVGKIRDHLRHMTDGRWHDTCHWCLHRRAHGGDGLTDAEREQYRQSLAGPTTQEGTRP